MAPTVNSEQEPEDVSSGFGVSVGPKGRRSLSQSRRELTEEELAQSGVRLMMLDELDRLDGEVARLRGYEDRYHTADRRIAVLEVEKQRRVSVDIVHAICVGFGTGFLMLIPTLPSEPSTQRWFTAIVGGVLLVAGTVLKVRARS